MKNKNRLSDNLRNFQENFRKFSKIFGVLNSAGIPDSRFFPAYYKFRVASSRVKSAPENILFQRFFAQKRDHGAHDLYERRLF